MIAAQKQPIFHVGNVPVHGDLILAPMEGYSDLPFRSICREMGSAMSYTAFINAIDVINKAPYLRQKMEYLHWERPVVFQLFDNDTDRLLDAALRLQELEPDIIDINLGCSVRRVSGRGAGAGLLRTPLKVARTFKKISSALQVPLTAKIRLGWDQDQLNYCLIARVIEDHGGAMVAVHGRTKNQGYRGRADWDAIARIRSVVSIPVIGNGDVVSVLDIDRLKSHTGCQAVMIGRAAVGNPWIFSRRERESVSPDEVADIARHHLERMIDFYGPRQGVILFRKHAKRYARADRLSAAARTRFLTAEDPDQMLRELNAVLH